MDITRRSWRLTAPLLALLFFGGGYAGTLLARWMAPESALAEFVSFLALPAGLIGGFWLWAGAALLVLLQRRLRGRHAVTNGTANIAVLPGASAFIPTTLVSCILAGAIVGVLSTAYSFIAVIGVYAITGLAYGVLCQRLAQAGYLPFPDE